MTVLVTEGYARVALLEGDKARDGRSTKTVAMKSMVGEWIVVTVISFRTLLD